jgi:hypothetical protein
MKTPERNRQAGPICKFGPGGDFIAIWQPEPSESSEVSNCLVKLLISAVEALDVVIDLKRISSYVPLRKAFCSDELTVCHKEKVINAVENSKADNTVDSAPTATIENGSSFPREPKLFPNLSRNGIRIKHKPKHNIRTYRRTAKKRSTFRLSKQGSLFESQFQSAQTA